MNLATRASSVVLAVLVVAAIAASLLLTSPRPISHEDAIPWQPGSPLKTVCTLLAFNYAIPTPQGVAVKQLVFHLALAGLAVVAVFGAIVAQRRRPWEPPSPEQPGAIAGGWQRLNAATSAKLLFVLLAVWALAAIGWSHAPAVTWGRSALLALAIVWALLVGQGLWLGSGQIIAAGLVAAAVVTSAVSIWYQHERLPTERVGYPIGNPLFLAACITPAILLALSAMADWLQRLHRRLRAGLIVWLLLGAGALGVLGWAFALTEARGAMIGLVAGLATLGLLTVPRRWALPAAAVLIAVGMMAVGLYARGQLTTSDYSRSATVRVRLYAWQAAGEMAARSPLVGLGPGCYPLLANDLLAEQRVRDPAVLVGSQMDHAHSEFLELLAEYGAVGLALLLIPLVLTAWSSWQALGRAVDGGVRWLLAGCLASLVALAVEECTDVALRIPPLPVVFWTILGLNWHLVRATQPMPTRPRMPGIGMLGVLALLVLGVGATSALLGWRDFAGARAAAVALSSLDDADGPRPVQVWPEPDLRAVEAADRAARLRIEPFRKVQAMVSQMITRNHVAASALNAVDQRMAVTTQPDQLANDLAIATLAQLARRQVDEVLLLAEKLNRTAADVMGAGRAEADAAAMGMMLAHLDNDRREFDRYQTRRGQALRRERRVQPFDADVLLQLFSEAQDMPLAARVTLLRDCLRAPIPPDVLWQMVRDLVSPELLTGLSELLQYVEQAEQQPNPDDWQDPLAPETLRLAAIVAWAQYSPCEAVDFVDRAAELYRQAGDRFQIQQAETQFERARYIWFANPDEPMEALVNLDQARCMVPDSYVGRKLDEHNMGVYIGVRLSCGLEDSVRRMLAGQVPEDQMDLAIARAYWSIIRAMLQMPPELRSKRLPEWLGRVEELAGDMPEIPMARAQLAAEQEDFVAAEQYWKQAIAAGVPAESVLFFVRQFLAMYPHNATLTELQEELLPSTRPTTRGAQD